MFSWNFFFHPTVTVELELIVYYKRHMQVFPAVFVIFLSAPNVYSSLSSYGIPGQKYDSFKHLRIVCHVGCYGTWWIHHFKR